MSDTNGSPFEAFTEAEVGHIQPTEAVNSEDVVVSPVRSIGSEPQCELLVLCLTPVMQVLLDRIP